MNKGLVIAAALAGLAACSAAPAPDRGRGVGFDDYAQFELERAQREAALSAPDGTIIPAARVNTIASPVSPPFIVPGTPSTSVPAAVIPSSALAEAGIGRSVVQQTAPLNTGGDPTRIQGVDASPGNPTPAIINNPGISDEQNFDAVAGRETIQSDADRRAAQAAAREQIQPTAVPERPSNTGPNIVEYAINAPNVKGQEWYSRSLLSGQGRFQRNCAGYGTADDAQRDFLARGGPERDRLGIDPDGDGFACGWDPAPYKRAAGN
ncbi:hypothetical protein [Yoonia sp.]|uniref:hypothetical protein n=1 Tax=Yoonia sp. TaxID=2212373 RepID=UPI0025D3EBEF|nr:hypothetical protein [Yoonia sp.]